LKENPNAEEADKAAAEPKNARRDKDVFISRFPLEIRQCPPQPGSPDGTNRGDDLIP
jgi:hypothetical protein